MTARVASIITGFVQSLTAHSTNHVLYNKPINFNKNTRHAILLVEPLGLVCAHIEFLQCSLSGQKMVDHPNFETSVPNLAWSETLCRIICNEDQKSNKSKREEKEVSFMYSV